MNSAPAVLRSVGKNPNIIFADCSYTEMLETTVRSSFQNQGEICLCGSRIFVEKKIYEKFKTDFTAKVRTLKVGDPLESSTDQGAIVSKQHMEKILSYIDLGTSRTFLIAYSYASVRSRCHRPLVY